MKFLKEFHSQHDDIKIAASVWLDEERNVYQILITKKNDTTPDASSYFDRSELLRLTTLIRRAGEYIDGIK